MSNRPDFAARYGPWALVAGGTEGLGLAWSHEAAARGCNVVLVGLDPEQAQTAADEVASKHGVETLAIAHDLGRDDTPAVLAECIGDREVGLLICNAASSHIGAFLAAPIATHEQAVDVNVRTALRLVHAHAGVMAERGRGGMVLMASMSGLQGSPLVASYAATKAYLLVLGEGLHVELRPRGVDVLSVIGPTIDTPNFRRSSPAGSPSTTSPEVVAREGLDALGKASSWVPGRANRAAAAVLRALPRRRAVAVVGNATRKLYPGR